MSISYISATSATTSSDGASTVTVNMPVSTAVGDILVGVVALTTPTNADVNLSTVPSGWTLAGGAVDVSTTGAGVRMNVYTHAVTSSEPTSFSWSASGVPGRIAASILAYRGSDGIPSGEFVTALQTTSSTARASGQITVGQNTRVVTLVSDRVGSSQTFYPADVARITVNTANVGFGVGDSNGAVPVGTLSKTTNTAVASDVGVNIIFGLHAAQAANVAPTVSAGSNQNVASGTTVTLVGTATDTDGSIASVQWSQDSGTAATINGATSNTATVTLSAAGTYVFRFTGYDNLGASSFSTVTITVTASPQTPPVARATASDSLYYLIDATTSSASNGGTLSYSIAPSAASTVATGKYLVSPTSAQTSYVVTVSESGVNTTTQVTVTIPAAGNSSGSNVTSTGVETLIFKSGSWS